MPTYEFKCGKCGHRFETFSTIAEKDNARCPECGSPDVSQIVSGFCIKGDSNCGTCRGSNCEGCSLKR